MKAEPGSVDVLNCGAGHLRVTFDTTDKIELENARRVISDILARGYALFIGTGKRLRKVTRFDPKRDEYIIGAGADAPPARRGDDTVLKNKSGRRVKAGSVSATAIAPTAGG